MANSDSRVSEEWEENTKVDTQENRSCTQIIIVRHGETDWNALKKVQGQLDVELNKVGRQQAVALAERLSKEDGDIAAIYSSDLMRAFDTAQMIATKCGGLQVIKDPDLREKHFGVLQGLVHSEARLNTRACEAALSTDQEIPGGGESRDQLHKRCTAVLPRIVQKHRGEKVVLVTHGAVIETLYKWVLPDKEPGGIANASVAIFLCCYDEDGAKWSIETWNDVSHLSEIGFLLSAVDSDASSA